MRAVVDVAAKAKINLSDGSMNASITRDQRFAWGAELGRAFPHEAHPSAADVQLEQSVTLAATDALAVTDNSSAVTFIGDLQGIQGTCAAVSAAAPATPSASAVTRIRTRTLVIFRVRGDAGASGADITYGSDSDNISPPEGLGMLGTGSAVPFTGSLRSRSSALYYAISAQLQGSGDITCSVSLKVTAFYSDGTHRSKSKVVAHGHAVGGYNICDAQVNN